MQVILTENVRNLGDIGELVKVKPGYGRNFLIPQGKALRATSDNVAQFEAQRAELEKRAQELLTQAKGRAEALTGVALTITARASEEGKLYGSVGPREISEALVAAGHAVEKSEVTMPEGPIHEISETDVVVQLHSDVEAIVKVNVVAE